MRLFLYGTLLDAATLARHSGDPALLARAMAATLQGWRRVALPHVLYPTLRRDAAGRVTGMLVDASAATVRLLQAYEGPEYRLTRVVVTTVRGKTGAHTWIAPGGTRRPWKG